MKKVKAVIFSAPSGAGKTTLVRHLMSIPEFKFEFSVSAASRPIRAGEVNGKDYYFMTKKEFEDKIAKQLFLEWEEVYSGSLYGTLKSEITRITENGHYPIFDVDVIGGLNLKKYFGNDALAVFVMPPDVETLEARLRCRNSETEESLAKRLAKATSELSYLKKFDKVILNDNLEKAKREAEKLVAEYLLKP